MKRRRKMPTPRGSLRDFANDTSGAVAIMAALAFPVLIGGMALGAEASFWYLTQRKLQQAADLAAYAAAVQLRSGREEDEMWPAARAVAEANGLQPSDEWDPHYPPSRGVRQDNRNAVELILLRQQTRYFTLIYSPDPVAISARAVAEVRGGGDACLLSLDPTGGMAIEVAGSAEVTFDGCDVATNSNAGNAFQMQGGAVRMTTGCVHSVGGANATGGLTMTNCTQPNIEAPVIPDPYADVSEPEVSGDCVSGDVGKNNDATTVTPTTDHALGMKSMRFCNGLNPRGNVTFAPGLYIIDGGELTLNAQTTVVGSGVTFYLANGARLGFNGGATLELAAPETGPLAGLLFFGGRGSVGTQHTINGTAGSRLNGAVYLPSGDLDYRGNYSGSNGCTQIVTRRIVFSGNSSLSVNCSAAGTRRIAVAETIALVE